MRLHIVTNEKIINRCIDNFEVVHPGQNKWIVLQSDSSRDYVDNRKEVFKCQYDSALFWEIVGDVEYYDKIIIHFLTKDSARFVCKIDHPNIYWIEWGFDLYNILLQYKGYQLYSDVRLQKRYSNHKKLGILYPIYQQLSLLRLQHLYYRAAKKIRFFIPDSMYDEYPLLLEYYPKLKHLQYKEFFYYPLDEVLGTDYEHKDLLGYNIIIGNSASLSGNHYEVIDLLSKINIGSRKIVVPLSYGLKRYGDDVELYGKKHFGSQFRAIRDFMPLKEYNKVLRSANFFIYNNYRQEAVGNILVALYLGGKVFINRKNPLLKFYKGLGIHIYDLSALCLDEGFSPLTQEKIDNNRRILMSHYSKERQLELIKNNL